jgi:hypothetical protein
MPGLHIILRLRQKLILIKDITLDVTTVCSIIKCYTNLDLRRILL